MPFCLDFLLTLPSSLLQIATVFLLQIAAKFYYKTRRFHNKTRQVLQNVSIITKRGSTVLNQFERLQG